MKLFKLIVITLCVMVTMSACGGWGGVSDESVVVSGGGEVSSVAVTTAIPEVTTVPETTTAEETTTPPKDYSIEVELNGEVVVVPVDDIPIYVDSISEDTQLYLAERAAQLIIDLDRDFDNTIGQFKYCCDWHSELISDLFNHSENTISSILNIRPSTYRVLILTEFYRYQTSAEIFVSFTVEGDEYIIEHVGDVKWGH